MKRFAALYKALDASSATTDKVAALADYFTEAAPEDAAWAVAMLSGRRPKRLIRAGELRAAVVEFTGLPDWLIDQSYAHVGDLAETIALLGDAVIDSGQVTGELPSLACFVENELRTLPALDETGRRAQLLRWWQRGDRDTRFLLNKLITGSFRVGVSQRLVTQGLAHATGLPIDLLAERLAGDWTPDRSFHERLVAPAEAVHDTGRSGRPYPFFLASPLESDVESLGPRADWLVEWKWDGIRAQLIRRGETVALWSRGEERLDGRFPEVEAAAWNLPSGTVLDGEILVWRDGRPMPFTALQKRIGRLKPGAKSLAEQPVAFLAYDMLEMDGADWRERSMSERRVALEDIVGALAHPSIPLSPAVVADDWPALATLRDSSRERGVEGLMLKRLTSPYRAGRRRGDWWKWKVDPYTLDCVLVYAQAGHGRRATLFTDYTFAVWDGDALVPVAKAYSGLTDVEIDELDRWIRAHTRERFGPVRSVDAVQVFELGFEAIHVSGRHKSGVAVRFPRILRWRRDKPAAEADTLLTLKRMAGFEPPETA
jgi:DNA ligase-1